MLANSANEISISSLEVFVKRSDTFEEFFFKKFIELPTPLISPKFKRVLKEAGPGKPTLTGIVIFFLVSSSHQFINGAALKKIE